MKIKIYNAISIDGFIATPNHNTEWVSDTDWEEFSSQVKSSRAIIMGRKTYEVSGDDFPYDCELNVVMTRNQKLLDQEEEEGIWFTDTTPEEVLQELEDMGFRETLIIGGGNLNSSFLKANLVDEVIISIHPLILGKGIKLFENEEFRVELELIGSRVLNEELAQLTYAVIKD